MYIQSMIGKVQKWGNSLGVRLPKALAKEVQVSIGSEVDIKVANGEIVMKPVRRKKYRLDEMLAQITSDNLPEVVDMGGPVGKELL